MKATQIASLLDNSKTACTRYTRFLQLTTPAEARNQLAHLQRLARLFPERTDIRELCDWLAAQLADG